MDRKNKDSFDNTECQVEDNIEEKLDDIEQAEDSTSSASSEENIVEPVTDERDQMISSLNTELDEARNNLAKLTGMLQQLQADFDNFRKRNATITVDAKNKGIFEAVKALLPAFDAVHSAQKQITDENTLSGLEMVERQLNASLESLDITRIECVGKQFDPNLHHAVIAEEIEGVPSGQIVEEYSAGYQSPAGIVRFATVKIAK